MRGMRLLAAMAAALLFLCSGIAWAEQEGASEADPAPSAPSAEEPGPEVKSERTQDSRTFRLPDGELRTQIFETPINYKTPGGEWKPIEEGLEEQPDGTGLTNGANSFDLSLPERIGAAPVRLSAGDLWIASRLLDQASTPAQLEGDTASYEAADPGTSFDFASLANGLKEDIEITDPSQPHSFRFKLDASTGLTPVLTKEGSIEFRDQDNEVAAVLPAPVMLDSTPGQPKLSNDVHYELAPRDENAWELTIDAGGEWLERPDLSWPVHIDPTLTLESPSLDCTFGGTKPPGTKVNLLEGANGWGLCGSGGQKELYARYRRTGSTDEWARSLLKFDLSSLGGIGKNPYILEARVKVNAPAAAVNTSGVELRRATKAWEKSAVWNKAGSLAGFWKLMGGDYTSEGAEVLTKDRGSQAGWWEFSGQGFTALVQNWLTNSLVYPQQGFLLKLLDDANLECNPSCKERSLTFDSSAAVDTSKRPRMEITYYEKAPSASKVTAPIEGTKTARRLKLKAGWSVAGVTGVTFQYREGTTGAFQTIPTSLVRDASGKEVKWPFATEGAHESNPLYFDAAHATSTLRSKGGTVQVRALFDGDLTSSGYSLPVKATVDRFVGGAHDATTSIGPGSVDLLTGNFTVSRADVSIPGITASLEFTRTHSSRAAGSEPTGVLGPGWKPGAPVEEAGGAEWRSVQEVVPSSEEQEEGFTAYVLLTDLEGYEYAFEKTGENTYLTPPELSGWVLKRENSSEIALSDPSGGRTVFKNSEASATTYAPVSVSQAGSPSSSRMVYEIVGGKLRLTKIIAPSRVECTDSNSTATSGCRTLILTYQHPAEWGGTSEKGDRLTKIAYWGPKVELNGSLEVAKYSYNPEGRLTAEWDPRISPELKETYAYTAGGQIQTIAPPGVEPWTFEYGSFDEEEANGRLVSVKRPSLVASPTVAQTTIVYGTPLSGSGAPYDLSGTAVAAWGQKDIPTDATAILPADEPELKGYARATVYYMDAEGWQVNVATPSGAGTSAPSLTTAETDEFGNVVRELTAQNRLRVLAAPEAERKQRYEELETKRIFNADGTEMQEEWGPLHQVRLENGETKKARLHTTVQYEDAKEGWPGIGPNPHLPTQETTGASIPGEGKDADQRVTQTKYNWTLLKPSETIVDPLGLNLHSRTAYNEYGQPTEISTPANSKGGDAHTTMIVYSNGLNCLSVAYSGLPCEIKPAAQPGTPGQPELPVKKIKGYTQLSAPTEVIESPGGKEETGSTRKTIKTYDEAGREITGKQIGGGTPLPSTHTVYDKETGLPVEQALTCESECGAGFGYASAFGEAGSATGQFNHPADVAIDAKGNLWVADKANNRIEQFTEGGGLPKAFGSLGSTGGKLNSPSGIVIDPNGNVWVTDTANTRVEEFNEKGEFLATFGTNVNKTKVESGGTQAEKNLCTAASGNVCQAGTAGGLEGQMKEPVGIGVSSGGNLYVVERGNGRVEKFGPTGELLAKFGGSGGGTGQFKEPSAVAVAPDASLWVADSGNNRIQHWSSTFSLLGTYGKEGSGNGEFKHPDAIEADSSGNVLVADQGNQRVQKLSSSGAFIARFGAGEPGPGQFSFSDPVGIAVNAKGNVWVTDPGHNQIQKWAPQAEFDTQAVVTAYDKLGRPDKYTDADANTSEVTYDLLGRPVKTSDGKGAQTFGYDATSGLLTKLEDSAAGTFTAAYNADGSMTEEGLPDGLVAKTTYDETGAPAKLSYTKVTSCSEKCTWLEENAERSIYGQILSQSSLASSQQYTYDKAGRLTLVKDTPQSGGCTTRSYSFDADSNRTALVTRAPGEGGTCDTSSKGTPQEYKYDTADRLIGEGIEYDSFGRITSLPGTYAGGSTLKTSFYSNEMLASQSQGGLTNSYQLDATGRVRQVVQTGSKEGTEVLHYAGSSDSPVWTERGSTWTRYIVGIGGLGAIQSSTGETSLPLANLHGDVIATASLSPTAKEPTAKFEFDEFGNPEKGSAGRFGWLGGKQRRTELPSGIIQMGVRSYVPALGRFISSDPVVGGSANAYDYTNQDPVNQFDLDGRVSGCGLKVSVKSHEHRLWTHAQYHCPKSAWPFGHALLKMEVRFERHSKGAVDEFLYGPFETKGHASWKPPNPSDPKLRNWGARENYRCGDLGREYRITYILTIMYQSPANGVMKSHEEEVTAHGTAVCRR